VQKTKSSFSYLCTSLPPDAGQHSFATIVSTGTDYFVVTRA
jgi:hypothetical protein